MAKFELVFSVPDGPNRMKRLSVESDRGYDLYEFYVKNTRKNKHEFEMKDKKTTAKKPEKKDAKGKYDKNNGKNSKPSKKK